MLRIIYKKNNIAEDKIPLISRFLHRKSCKNTNAKFPPEKFANFSLESSYYLSYNRLNCQEANRNEGSINADLADSAGPVCGRAHGLLYLAGGLAAQHLRLGQLGHIGGPYIGTEFRCQRLSDLHEGHAANVSGPEEAGSSSHFLQ